jgi:hypothetical protein
VLLRIKKGKDYVIDNNIQNIDFLKIDTEGYELEVIKGAKETLKKTQFALIEARHNHISFQHQYKLSELMRLMTDNGFVLDMIITAKPFIADLCFVKINKN